jgi:hypothetical protein
MLNFNLTLQRSLLFALLTIVLMLVFFQGIPSLSFLFIHDEYLPFPGYEADNQFLVRTFLDLGSSNTFQLIASLQDRIYYALAYSCGLSLKETQLLLYGIKLFLIMLLPYLGFSRLARMFGGNIREEIVLMASLWYSFNTYTVIYWHGNAFSFTLLNCYALAPLAIFWWEKVIFPEVESMPSCSKHLKNTLTLAQFLFIMSFALYLFAPFVLLLMAYTILRLAISRSKPLTVIKHLTYLTIACIPLFSVHLMVIYEMFFLSVGSHDASGGGTYGHLPGGLLYMATMWFAWTIYTFWTPRNIWTFADYYHTALAITAPFVLYALVFWGVIRQRRNSFIIIFTLLVLLFILLVKGDQSPLGDLYLFLLEYVPGFRVFRSPDSKFGFPIVLSLAILLLLAGKAIKPRVFSVTLGFVIIVQCWPLFTGVAIQGENSAASSDRVISIPKDFREVADFMNHSERSFGYLFPVPPVSFGSYQLSENEEHTGQDLLLNMINFPFIYGSGYSGMAKPTYEQLTDHLETEEYRQLRDFSVRYYVIRNDSQIKMKNQEQIVKFIKKNYKIIFQNSTFIVYEDTETLPLVEEAGMTFEVVNSTRINIKFIPHQTPGELVLHQSYHPSLYLYAGTSKEEPKAEKGESITLLTNWVETLSFLWKNPISVESHRMSYGYSNVWDIPKAETTSSEEYPLGYSGLTIFYWPQALFYLLATISALFFSGYFLALGIISIRNRRAC